MAKAAIAPCQAATDNHRVLLLRPDLLLGARTNLAWEPGRAWSVRPIASATEDAISKSVGFHLQGHRPGVPHSLNETMQLAGSSKASRLGWSIVCQMYASQTRTASLIPY